MSPTQTRPERHFPAIFWLAFILLLTACHSQQTIAPRVLHLNLGMEPATLDPALASDPGSQQISRMIFLSLVDTDSATGGPQHALATSWAVSADGLVWEFKLRDDAVWVRYNPDNQRIEQKRPVTADDVVYSFRRIFDPRVGSSFAPFFAPLIRGAQELYRADPKRRSDADLEPLFNGLGVQKVDDTTVRFFLLKPASYFPSVLSTWLGRTQPREAIQAGASAWTEPGTLWTDGPYVVSQWAHGREIVLQKNTYWYDASTVHIDEIHFAMIGSTAIALEEYKNGNLDSLDPYGGLTPKDVASLEEDPVLKGQLRIVPSLCSQYYGFNTAKPPFNDVRVRKAFVAAVDRDTVVSSVVQLGEPARWFDRPGLFASLDVSDTIGVPFNINQARELLKQAGYGAAKNEKKLPVIDLGLNTDDMHKYVAETLAQMWKNNLGVEVRVTETDWKKYLQLLHDDPPMIFRFGWCAYYPDTASFAGVFHSGSPDNFTRWGSASFDQAVDAAARETDIEKRRDLYRSMEKILVEDDAVILPLWWSQRATLTRPNVQRTYAITDGYERLETWNMR